MKRRHWAWLYGTFRKGGENMQGLSKGESLELLRSYGMNTPQFRVFKKPFNREEMIRGSFEFPGNISVRTWRAGKIMCPFFPNRFGGDVPNIIDDLFSLHPDLDEIIFSEGINPQDSLKCGRLSHIEIPGDDAYAVIEYFEGPGTVRELDNKVNEKVKRMTVGKYNQPTNGDAWISDLIRKCRMIFHVYPRATLEWSIYPTKIGTKKDNLIWWEIL
jgi:hypothetical protein